MAPLCKGSCHEVTEGLTIIHHSSLIIHCHLITIPPSLQANPPPFAQGRLFRIRTPRLKYNFVQSSLFRRCYDLLQTMAPLCKGSYHEVTEGLTIIHYSSFITHYSLSPYYNPSEFAGKPT